MNDVVDVIGGSALILTKAILSTNTVMIGSASHNKTWIVLSMMRATAAYIVHATRDPGQQY
jgi:hypothetical protein